MCVRQTRIRRRPATSKGKHGGRSSGKAMTAPDKKQDDPRHHRIAGVLHMPAFRPEVSSLCKEAKGTVAIGDGAKGLTSNPLISLGSSTHPGGGSGRARPCPPTSFTLFQRS
jgi:hypothetical protein